jgi:hypothetical protein
MYRKIKGCSPFDRDSDIGAIDGSTRHDEPLAMITGANFAGWHGSYRDDGTPTLAGDTPTTQDVRGNSGSMARSY